MEMECYADILFLFLKDSSVSFVKKKKKHTHQSDISLFTQNIRGEKIT